MEAEKRLQVRYTVMNYDQVPSRVIDEGAVSVGSAEEAEAVAKQILGEISLTHANRGYAYGRSVVLEEVMPNKRLIEVYADCI